MSVVKNQNMGETWYSLFDGAQRVAVDDHIAAVRVLKPGKIKAVNAIVGDMTASGESITLELNRVRAGTKAVVGTVEVEGTALLTDTAMATLSNTTVVSGDWLIMDISATDATRWTGLGLDVLIDHVG